MSGDGLKPLVYATGDTRYNGYRLADLERAYLEADREHRQALAREEDLQIAIRGALWHLREIRLGQSPAERACDVLERALAGSDERR